VIAEGEVIERKPLRKIFPGCCASAKETVARNIAAISQREFLGFIVFA
jgi:hypothetical protein